MDARADIASRLDSCARCALAPLCEAAREPLPPAVACRRRLDRGDTLIEPGAPVQSLFAVRAGFLKVVVPVPGGDAHIAAFPMPGDVVGLEGFNAHPAAVGIVALEDSEVCEVPLRRARILSDTFPEIAACLRELLARRLARTQAQFAAAAHRSAPQRLAGFISDMATQWSARGFAPDAFRLPMERREIANHLGLTIETVSRLLRDFRIRGWVEVKGRDVSILDAAALRACPRFP